MKSMPQNRKESSFWIPREAIVALFDAKASALAICAYLVLAKHTNKNGYLSSCGLTALIKRLRIGRNQALVAIDSLLNIKINNRYSLVFTAACWNDLASHLNRQERNDKWEYAPIGRKRAPVNWVLNIIDSDSTAGAWFSSSIVDDVLPVGGSPLSLLKHHAFGARLLLLMHSAYVFECQGVVPYELSMKAKLIASWPIEKYTLCQFELENSFYAPSTVTSTLYYLAEIEAKDENIHMLIAKLEEVITLLDFWGFVKKLILVMNGSPRSKESTVLYELDIKSEKCYIPRDEFMLSDKIAKIVEPLGVRSISGNGGFYRKYPVIVPAGIDAHVACIFRLEYRIRGDNNPHAKLASEERERRFSDAVNWIEAVEKILQADSVICENLNSDVVSAS